MVNLLGALPLPLLQNVTVAKKSVTAAKTNVGPAHKQAVGCRPKFETIGSEKKK